MDRNFDQVLQDALSLDHDSKVELADRLAVDLSEHDEHLQAWVKESNSRFDQYQRGEITASDARSAIDRIRKSLFSK
jgi:hypothetical protein